MKTLSHSRTTVHNIGYHLVWSTKYRRRVLAGAIAVRAKELLLETASRYGWRIEAIEVMPDHVHVFVKADPKTPTWRIYKALKGVSASRLSKEFPGTKKMLWRHFWNPSTYIETIGHISQATVEKYIADQKVATCT